METIIGTIEKKSCEDGLSKVTQKPYVRCVFVIDGKTYSTFNKDIMKEFNVKDNVKMEGEFELGKDGNEYFNMKTMDYSNQEATKVAESGSNEEEELGHVIVELLRQILAELKRR